MVATVVFSWESSSFLFSKQFILLCCSVLLLNVAWRYLIGRFFSTNRCDCTETVPRESYSFLLKNISLLLCCSALLVMGTWWYLIGRLLSTNRCGCTESIVSFSSYILSFFLGYP